MAESAVELKEKAVKAEKLRLFERTLVDVREMTRARNLVPSKVFFTYAWENDEKTNNELQAFLNDLRDNLLMAGVKDVFYDIYDMQGNMKETMKTRIEDADLIILIGTPRYRQRALDTSTNVAYEFQQVIEKLKSNPHALLPILYSGSFTESFPDMVGENLVRFKEKNGMNSLDLSFTNLLGLNNPIGILGIVYPGLERINEYVLVVERFIRDLKDINTFAERDVVITDNIPASSPYFVGRAAQFDEIDVGLKSDPQGVLIIQGPGGTGKSQLAAEVAHRAKDEQAYQQVCWLTAEDSNALFLAFTKIGDQLKVDRTQFKDSPALLIQAILQRLNDFSKVLLIFDNVESLDYLKMYLGSPRKASKIRVLITTRNPLGDASYKIVCIQEFGDADLKEFMVKRGFLDVDPETLKTLGKQLDYLPLAIVQAVGYILKYEYSVPSFLVLLQNEKKAVKETGVGAMWAFSRSKLSSKALELIRLCAFLQPDAIPRKWLEMYVGVDDCHEVLYELRSQSLLVSIQLQESFRIHRLLQTAIRFQFKEEEGYKKEVKAILDKALALLENSELIEECTSLSSLGVFWREQKHVRLIGQLVHLTDELDLLDEVNVNPMAVVSVINWTAEFLWNVNFEFDKSLGLFEKAMELIKRSVEVDQKTRDLKMARLIYRKGGIFYDQGKYDLALSCFQQALEIQEANLKNRQHVDVASGLSNIGVVYSSKGDYDLALKYLEQSLEIQKALFGDNIRMTNPLTLQTKNNISNAKRGLANQKRRIADEENANSLDADPDPSSVPSRTSGFQFIWKYVPAGFPGVPACGLPRFLL